MSASGGVENISHYWWDNRDESFLWWSVKATTTITVEAVAIFIKLLTGSKQVVYKCNYSAVLLRQ